MPSWIVFAFFATSTLLGAVSLYLGFFLQKKYRGQCLIVFEPEDATIMVNGKHFKSTSPVSVPTKIGQKIEVMVKKPGYLDHQAAFIVRSAQSFYYCQLKRDIKLSVIDNPNPKPSTDSRRPQLELLNSQTYQIR